MGHVIVIGAGCSGLAAASTLHAAGLRVTVLEGDSRVGGRVKSSADGVREEGATWLHGGGPDHPLYHIAAELGVLRRPASLGPKVKKYTRWCSHGGCEPDKESKNMALTTCVLFLASKS